MASIDSTTETAQAQSNTIYWAICEAYTALYFMHKSMARPEAGRRADGIDEDLFRLVAAGGYKAISEALNAWDSLSEELVHAGALPPFHPVHFEDEAVTEPPQVPAGKPGDAEFIAQMRRFRDAADNVLKAFGDGTGGETPRGGS